MYGRITDTDCRNSLLLSMEYGSHHQEHHSNHCGCIHGDSHQRFGMYGSEFSYYDWILRLYVCRP